MSHLSMILNGLFLAMLVIYMAPGIFAMNRGHVLRNIALWLAIFFGLAAFYQTFGPDSPHPLFNLPDSMQGMNRSEAPKLSLPQTNDKKDGKADDNSEGDFTPPKE